MWDIAGQLVRVWDRSLWTVHRQTTQWVVCVVSMQRTKTYIDRWRRWCYFVWLKEWHSPLYQTLHSEKLLVKWHPCVTHAPDYIVKHTKEQSPHYSFVGIFIAPTCSEFFSFHACGQSVGLPQSSQLTLSKSTRSKLSYTFTLSPASTHVRTDLDTRAVFHSTACSPDRFGSSLLPLRACIPPRSRTWCLSCRSSLPGRRRGREPPGPDFRTTRLSVDKC